MPAVLCFNGNARYAAIGAAMDSAMEQGGAPAPQDGQGPAPAEDPGALVDADTQDDVDPSAGMG